MPLSRKGRKTQRPVKDNPSRTYGSDAKVTSHTEIERGKKKFTKSRFIKKQGSYSGAENNDKTTGYHKKDPRKSFRHEKNIKSSSQRKVFAGSEEIRLNRFLAHSGICSRREADEFIKAGLITVNGQVVKEMGIKVNPGDQVKYNGETIHSEKKVYILLNKPKDYITSLEDEQRRKTVMDLIRNACPERVFPVGRLDRNTTGVLLLTNDGELAAKLIHPRYKKKKIYQVSLDKNLKTEDLQAIAKGITLEDGPVTPDVISYVEGHKKSEIGIELHSGRNRIVRKIFEYFGYKVIKLDRVYFAGLTKKNLPRGKWRFLTEQEVNALKMNLHK
jgi:23S rRNA pseudouridine2605 synthase